MSTKTSLVTSRRAALTAGSWPPPRPALLTVGLAACGSSGSSGSSGAPASGGSAAATATRSRWASPRSAPRAAGAPPTPSRSRTPPRPPDRPEVLRRPAEAGEPDQGDPLLHPAEGRRHRLLARSSRPAGTPCSRRPRTRQHPGDPHRPRRRLRGHLALRDVPRLRLRRGGQEGRRVAGRTRTAATTDKVNVVELQGTTGSAPAIDRKKGFADAIAADAEPRRSSPRRPATSPAPAASRSWRRSSSPTRHHVVYAHNDDMGLGAIEAIEAAGKGPARTSRSSRSTRSRTA